MKKNKKIASIAILAILILLMVLAGYTFARYYQSINAGSASASIARWSFGSGNTETAINLSEELIFPGSEGQFYIEVDATDSQVPVEYEIQFTNEKNIPRNMKFSAVTTDEKGLSKRVQTVDSLDELAEKLDGIIECQDGNQKRYITVYWNWDFNIKDTTLTDSEDGSLLLDENGNIVYDENNLTSLDIGFDVEIIGRQGGSIS